MDGTTSYTCLHCSLSTVNLDEGSWKIISNHPCFNGLKNICVDDNNVVFREDAFDKENSLDVENNSNDTRNHLVTETTESDLRKSGDNEWGISETKFLLDKYETYLAMIGPMKKFKTKKIMWRQISSDLLEILKIRKSEIQCENRYKTVMKRKKKAIDNNNTSGSSRETVEYEEELKKIASVDDSIEPEILRGIGKITRKEGEPKCFKRLNASNSSESTSGTQEDAHNNIPARKRSKSLTETLIDLQTAKEQSKERRHQEKLNIMKELIGLLKKNE